jgi:hypothetical protein
VISPSKSLKIRVIHEGHGRKFYQNKFWSTACGLILLLSLIIHLARCHLFLSIPDEFLKYLQEARNSARAGNSHEGPYCLSRREKRVCSNSSEAWYTRNRRASRWPLVLQTISDPSSAIQTTSISASRNGAWSGEAYRFICTKALVPASSTRLLRLAWRVINSSSPTCCYR